MCYIRVSDLSCPYFPESDHGAGFIRDLLWIYYGGYGTIFILMHPKGGKNAQRIYGNARAEP